jgi:hypothetical protein
MSQSIDIREVLTNADIKELYRVAANFHDSCIAQYKCANDQIHVTLDSSYGFTIDLWFSGDVACSLNLLYLVNRGDPDWWRATVLMQDGYIYLVDNINVDLGKIGEELCWFRGKRLQYRITPNEES